MKRIVALIVLLGMWTSMHGQKIVPPLPTDVLARVGSTVITGRDLIEYWITYLSKAEGTVLRLLLDSWPAPMSKAAIAEAAGYSPTSGGFNGALARLRSLQLITGGAEAVYPDETLAEHAGSVDA